MIYFIHIYNANSLKAISRNANNPLDNLDNDINIYIYLFYALSTVSKRAQWRGTDDYYINDYDKRLYMKKIFKKNNIYSSYSCIFYHYSIDTYHRHTHSSSLERATCIIKTYRSFFLCSISKETHYRKFVIAARPLNRIYF